MRDEGLLEAIWTVNRLGKLISAATLEVKHGTASEIWLSTYVTTWSITTIGNTFNFVHLLCLSCIHSNVPGVSMGLNHGERGLLNGACSWRWSPSLSAPLRTSRPRSFPSRPAHSSHTLAQNLFKKKQNNQGTLHWISSSKSNIKLGQKYNDDCRIRTCASGERRGSRHSRTRHYKGSSLNFAP